MIRPLSTLLRTLKRPQITMPLLTLGVIVGWLLYTVVPAALSYDTIDTEQNLLANPSFEQWQGDVKEWEVKYPDTANVQVEEVGGFVDGSGLRLDILEYKDSNVVLYSPTVTVSPNSAYFFKTFYETDTHLDLMLVSTQTDGTTEQRVLKHYPDYDYPWSSMGSLIHTDNNDVSIRIAISFSSVGYAEFDSAFLVKSDASSPASLPGTNLLESTAWTLNQSEDYSGSSSDQNGVRTISLQNSTSGNTAWLPNAITVLPNELYSLAIRYSSTVPVEIGVDYTFVDGSTEYRSTQQLLPVAGITTYELSLEIPKNATSIQPSVQISSRGTLQTGDFTLVKLANPATFDTPRASITFDDGWLSSFTNGEHVLEEFGYKGTFYLNPGALNTENFMTTAMVVELIAKGHQLGSHTEDHIDLTSYSPDSIIKQLDDANSALRKLGIQDIDFASPYGKIDQRVLPYVMKRSLTHRGTDIGVNTKQNYNPSQLMGLFVRNTTTDDELRRMIQQAQDSNGWLILIYHQIESSQSPFIVDTQTLRRHLQILKESGVKVETVRKAAGELQAQL